MHTKRMLIVDDEPDVVTLLSRHFEEEGFEISSAADGHEAMIKALETHPNIVLLDYKLPVRDGLDVLQELKKVTPDTIVIIITGMGSEDVAVEAMKRGAKDYLRKPFDTEKLTELVRASIGEYFDGILKRNAEYAYPLEDPVIYAYEFLRTVYSTPNPDITSISARFGYRRNMFYVFDHDMRTYGVHGLFERTAKEPGSHPRPGERIYAAVPIPSAPEAAVHGERYAFSAFINPNDPVQMKLEMLREAATAMNPHVGNICRKYGVSRQFFYTVYERFVAQGVAGLLPRVKGRSPRNGAPAGPPAADTPAADA